MHIHSNFSDGKNTIFEMAEAAYRLGLKKICFTDHVRKDTKWVNDYISEIQRVRDLVPIEIQIGVETKIIDFHGNLDIPGDLPKDIIQVAAIHRITDGNGGYISKNDTDIINGERALECWFKALEGLKENKSVSRIAHPFSMVPFLKPKLDKDFWDRIENIFDDSDYLIELNLKYDNSFVPSHFWKKYKNRIVIGTDSHSINDLPVFLKRAKHYPLD